MQRNRRTKDQFPLEVGRQGKQCHDGRNNKQGKVQTKQVNDYKKQAFKSKVMEFGVKQKKPKENKKKCHDSKLYTRL